MSNTRKPFYDIKTYKLTYKDIQTDKHPYNQNLTVQQYFDTLSLGGTNALNGGRG